MTQDIMTFKSSKQTIIKTQKSFLDKYSFSKYEELLDQCVEDVEDILPKKPGIIIGGKMCRQKRNVGFFSNESKGYKYSGQVAKAIPLTKSLKKLLKKVNKKFGARYNGILINHYEDGMDNIGAHSDDIRYLDPKAGVVSVSYGATRTFRIKGRTDENKKYKKDIKIRHLDVVVMGGDFQLEFKHQIPAEENVRDPRFSFTFRCHSS